MLLPSLSPRLAAVSSSRDISQLVGEAMGGQAREGEEEVRELSALKQVARRQRRRLRVGVL